MVSQRPRRPAATSRERLLAAATEEFAARGFSGATVDRIAARAGLNKAMLYYHFPSKAVLYRDILRDLFGGVADAAEAVAAADERAAARLERFIDAVAHEAVARPHFPAIWLREMAEGGRHLDETVVRQMARVIEALARILGAGRAEGAFGPAHPLLTHISIVAPLLLFAASAPIRRRFAAVVPQAFAQLTDDVVIRHVQETTLSMLAADRAAAGASAVSRPRRRSS